jgi:hypothetical protein
MAGVSASRSNQSEPFGVIGIESMRLGAMVAESMTASF